MDNEAVILLDKAVVFDRRLDLDGKAISQTVRWQGQQQGELVVIDRAAVNQTRRDLFGFDLPTLPRLFGNAQTQELDSIETTLQGASQAGEGRWVFRLADGSSWRQIDSDPVRFQNRAGQEVRVRKASLGSFLLTVGNSRAVRVRRQ